MVLACVGAPARAQTPDWLFPDRALVPALRAGPRDPVTQGQLVYDRNNLTAYGTGVAGEVSISAAAALVRLAGTGPDDALVIGLEAAAFSRFALQVVTRELVNTDWVFAVPLVKHRGHHWARLRYYHTSSHLGDEMQRRFDSAGVNFSRDGADLTAYLRPMPSLGLYGLAFWSVNSHPEERAFWEWRCGVEVDPRHGQLRQLYLFADLHAEEATRRRPRLAIQTGLWLPPVGGRPLRLGLQVLDGSSPMGQFRHRSARSLGLALYWAP